jgi:hypothetical protein
MEFSELFLLAGLFIAFYSVCLWAAGQAHEDFEDGQMTEPYDSFYAGIYKSLWHSHDLDFERVSIQDIALAEQHTDSVKMLDIACGISPHACWFKQLGVEFTGADNSKDMLSQAEKDCPTAKFKLVDVLKASVFPPKTFTTCLVLGFSIYEFQNPKVIFDTASAFDATTNYRFQPLIAGYYQVNGTVRLGGTTGAELIIALYKTGAVYSRGGDIAIASLGTCQLTFNEVVSLNGSTDYIELYGYVNAASGQQLAYISADITSRFSASLVRGA